MTPAYDPRTGVYCDGTSGVVGLTRLVTRGAAESEAQITAFLHRWSPVTSKWPELARKHFEDEIRALVELGRAEERERVERRA